jgi:DNA-directed RNA polymerase specialized sigma subunit
VNRFKNQLIKLLGGRIKEINKNQTNELGLKCAFSKIKDEMNNYRESINENTNEIQSNYEYMCRIDSKINKMSERIDEISMFIQNNATTNSSINQIKNQFSVSTLTTKEQEIFMAIYTQDDVSYKEIGRKICLTENLVVCYVTNLMTKGIPVIKRYDGEEVRLAIEPDFKSVQAKENILGINETITQAVMV